MNGMHIKIIGVVLGVALVGTAVYYSLLSHDQTQVNVKYPTYDVLNFASYDDFNSYLETSTGSSSYRSSLGGEELMAPTFNAADDGDAMEKASSVGNDYSETNIQEIGVDEPDIVKTDGTYLYVISSSKLYIIYAYPAEDAEIISTITFNESTYPLNLFVYGDTIAVIAQSYLYRTYLVEDVKGGTVFESSSDEDVDVSSVDSSYGSIWADTTSTHVFIYDVSSKSDPVMTQDIQMQGYYSNARMIDSYVYVITVLYDYSPIYYITDDEVYVPQYRVNGVVKEIGLSDIYYVDSPDISKTQTHIMSVNIDGESEEVRAEMFLLGETSTVYVSSDSIYITSVSYNYDYSLLYELIQTYVLPELPTDASDELELVDSLSLEDYQKNSVSEWVIQHYIDELDEDQKQEIAQQIVTQYEKTTIHKISIDQGDISYIAQGTVPGTVNNQFSLSEHDGYLRVATTVHGWMMSSYLSSVDSYNNVYVLDDSLNTVGKIESIAVGETIYSVRFMDSICYVVTYEQIDPFFVIDLADPENPVILGELKIPGYSTYLHPYDDTHIIGIGKEDNDVKVTLFEVEDVSSPREVATYQLQQETDEYYWSYSTALYEHKAFLFDQEKQLLIIPISVDYKESAYVFDISDDGIALKGVITQESSTSGSDEKDPDYDVYWFGDYSYSIKRSLYIGDVIYTISDAMVQMNDMQDLNEINHIILS